MVQNKNSKIDKNKLNVWINNIEYIILFISIMVFLLFIIMLLIIKYVFVLKFNLLWGFSLGYVFACASFFVGVISIKLTLKYKLVFLYYFLFFARMFVYGIPIVIYSQFESAFNILTIVIGLSIVWISTFMTSIFLNFKERRKEVKNDFDVKSNSG